jgi:hypothetical protein
MKIKTIYYVSLFIVRSVHLHKFFKDEDIMLIVNVIAFIALRVLKGKNDSVKDDMKEK